MKQVLKAFFTILALLSGAYLLRESMSTSEHSADPVFALAGLLILAGGLTAAWMHYKDKP